MALTNRLKSTVSHLAGRKCAGQVYQRSSRSPTCAISRAPSSFEGGMKRKAQHMKRELFTEIIRENHGA